MLRVLVVLPMYGGSLPVGRCAVRGLQEAGCRVDTFEAPDFHPSFDGLKNLKVPFDKLEYLQNSFLQVMNQALYAKVEAFAPDLVLCMAQAPMSRQTLKRLKKDGVPTAMWFVEDHRLFTYWRAFAPYYDIFAVIQKEPFLSELAASGVENVLYLPLAAEPSVHRPLELTPEERREFGSDLSFMGAGYPNRRRAFTRFIGRNFKIWGTEWEDEPLLAPLVQREGRRIGMEDAVKIYNAAAVNLNLHSSVQAGAFVSDGDFVNPRTFEIAACGGFQLTDRRSLMGELYSEDEIAVFSDMEELETKLSHYLSRPEERKAMAEKARTKTLAEHTYARRMRTLLDFAEERLPEFGKKREVQWPEEMPEALRNSAGGLLEELGLPPKASFDEVASALRSKSGKLSSLETALLFLDEWKKLYRRN